MTEQEQALQQLLTAGPTRDTAAVLRLWTRLLDAFDGHPPSLVPYLVRKLFLVSVDGSLLARERDAWARERGVRLRELDDPGY